MHDYSAEEIGSIAVQKSFTRTRYTRNRYSKQIHLIFRRKRFTLLPYVFNLSPLLKKKTLYAPSRIMIAVTYLFVTSPYKAFTQKNLHFKSTFAHAYRHACAMQTKYPNKRRRNCTYHRSLLTINDTSSSQIVKAALKLTRTTVDGQRDVFRSGFCGHSAYF